MKQVKRIEIVIDAAHTELLIGALKKVGSNDYTLLHDVQGAGDRGERLGDALTDALNNNYILVACAPEMLDGILDAVQPMLSQHGGVCLISDALWLEH
jgi:nitrogen regulatory protein PII